MIQPDGQPGSAILEEQVEKQADFAQLSLLLARLADRERELVALKYGGGFTNRAIAQLTGLTRIECSGDSPPLPADPAFRMGGKKMNDNFIHQFGKPRPPRRQFAVSLYIKDK